jgi:hypothetical protein
MRAGEVSSFVNGKGSILRADGGVLYCRADANPCSSRIRPFRDCGMPFCELARLSQSYINYMSGMTTISVPIRA